MATLDQLYRAYLNEDPNVSQMKYDPFSWNIEQTFDDTTDDTVDAGGGGGGGGITNAYYVPQGVGDGGAFDYLQNPLDPITTSGTYDNPWAGEIGPHYEGYSDDMLPAIGEDEDEEVKFLDSPFGWAKQKWGNLTPGQQKTGIIGASSFLPFPLNVAGMASQFLPKSEGYKVGGLDPMGKGLYNTLAAEGMLFEHSTGLKTSTGKNLVFGDTLFGNNYVEGQQDIWDENYAGKSEDEILAEFKAYARKHNKKDYGDTLENWKNSNTYMFNKYFESKATTSYLDQVKENQKKEIDRIQKKIDDELKGKIVPPGPHGEPYDAPTTPINMGTMRGQGPLHDVTPSVVSKPAAPAQVHHHTGGEGNQGGSYTGAGTQAPGSAAAGPMSGGYGPWSKAKGGLIRKKYGNGGIVDLL